MPQREATGHLTPSLTTELARGLPGVAAAAPAWLLFPRPILQGFQPCPCCEPLTVSCVLRTKWLTLACPFPLVPALCHLPTPGKLVILKQRLVLQSPLLLAFVFETGSQCSPGYPQNHRNLPGFASSVLGLKLCVTTLSPDSTLVKCPSNRGLSLNPV